MSSTSTGREAEQKVADFLTARGYTLVDQNWRTRYCEIDLVMTKGKVVYFIEVKYRSSDQYGGGLEYITPKKQQQMRFAAEVWLSKHRWEGDAGLLGVEVSSVGQIDLVEL